MDIEKPQGFLTHLRLMHAKGLREQRPQSIQADNTYRNRIGSSWLIRFVEDGHLHDVEDSPANWPEARQKMSTPILLEAPQVSEETVTSSLISWLHPWASLQCGMLMLFLHGLQAGFK